MNDKLTIQDLTDLLADKHGLSKKDAEAFVKEFFVLIEQALENDKYVKIKGLGTFKLIDVESRESVDVNTGERIEIKGHTKVSFTPDSTVREVVNKPFSHFETVALRDSVVLEDTPIIDGDFDNDESDFDNLSSEESIYESADVSENSETKIDESPSEEQSQGKIEGDDQEEVATVSQEEVITTSQEKDLTGDHEELLQEVEVKPDSALDLVEEEVEMPTEQQAEQQPETQLQRRLTAEEIIALELQNDRFALHSDKGIGGSKRKEKSSALSLVITIAIVLVLCGGVVLLIYYPDLLSSQSVTEQLDPPTTIAKQSPVQLVAPIDTIVPKDTLSPDSSKLKVEKSIKEVAKVKDQSLPKLKSETIENRKESRVVSESKQLPNVDSVGYKVIGTKATYVIKEGETLTRVAMKFYGTKALWPYLVKYNKDVIKNPDHVPYGVKIKIPELQKK